MILDDIVSSKQEQIKREIEHVSIDQLKEQGKGLVIRDFKNALAKPGMSIIAEVKKASPSKGIILEEFDPVKIASIYEEISIDAVSVLTEKKYFMGHDDYIRMVKEVNSKPILRKDFIIHPYQIYQAKAIGADAVLLIVSVLQNKLKQYYDLALELGLQCLVEVHDDEELKIASDSGCSIIGVNNRNLKDFTVSLKNTERLMKYMPKGAVVVSESGIQTPQHIQYLSSIGVDSVLIGETFMRNIHSMNVLNSFIKDSNHIV